jgi:hypothetical protein
MEAYYALAQGWAAQEIGSEEIRRWIRECKKLRPPGNTTVLLALKNSGVPHRSSGKPKGGRARLELVGSPFFPRPQKPRRGLQAK